MRDTGNIVFTAIDPSQQLSALFVRSPQALKWAALLDVERIMKDSVGSALKVRVHA